MRNNIIDILIPTFNNANQLTQCVKSVMGNRQCEGMVHVYVINNGHKNSCDFLKGVYKELEVLDMEDNLGWEGGLKVGLEHSTAPFVMFLNDDTYIPISSHNWLNRMLQQFVHDDVAAVGPSSNTVMGWQNIWVDVPYPVFEVKFLIFFCVLLRRSAIDKVGGIDSTLPGGDDFDMSIRLREAGYRLVVDRNTFVFHHGFQTGIRVYGDHTKDGGWNSYGFKEKTDLALIRKHGFKKWWEVISSAYHFPQLAFNYKDTDVEQAMIIPYIKGDVVLDMGCGGNKTIPTAVGIDMVMENEFINTLTAGTKSQADVIADVSKPLPFENGSVDTIVARHILEHMIDPIDVLKLWRDLLKSAGRIIIAVPNSYLIDSIPMNIEHVHAFTPDSMVNLLNVCGFKILEQVDPDNGISFVTVGEKI